MIAVVQAQDAEVTEALLANEAMSVTRLPSLGAFLGRRNATSKAGHIAPSKANMTSGFISDSRA